MGGYMRSRAYQAMINPHCHSNRKTEVIPRQWLSCELLPQGNYWHHYEKYPHSTQLGKYR
eukprot:10232575-Ditylum_brightwellii.AAC.1